MKYSYFISSGLFINIQEYVRIFPHLVKKYLLIYQ